MAAAVESVQLALQLKLVEAKDKEAKEQLETDRARLAMHLEDQRAFICADGAGAQADLDRMAKRHMMSVSTQVKAASPNGDARMDELGNFKAAEILVPLGWRPNDPAQQAEALEV